MLLTIENLSVSFGNANTSVCALDKVSLCLSSNETLGIIGESGSGKTTLGLSIMGLLTQANIYGEIEFDGCKLMSLNGNGWRKVRWKRIAMVFQNALEVFNPVITVGEQVAEPLITHMHLPKEDALAKVSELFKMTGLEPKWRNAYAH
ncbi:MAG: ATP-binding cassette domain-containing protein, partial [Desulfobacteraceae bacterium]